MRELNIYEEFLEYLEPHTEKDILSIEQLDYQGGKFNDFNAPVNTYTLGQFKEVANRTFHLKEFQEFKRIPGLDPRTKVYANFSDGSRGAFEILFGEVNLIVTWSSIPK